MSNVRMPRTGGLHLPADVGVSQAQAASIADEWDTLQHVNANLAARGMQPNLEPDIVYTPVTAAQLTTANMNDYTVTFACHLRWYNYAVRLLADIRAEILGIDNRMGDIARIKRESFRKLDEGKKKSERMGAQEMTDSIESDPIYHTLKLRWQELEQARIKVDAWAEEMERNHKTVSRQIENRKTEALGGDRANNMPRHASGGTWTGRPGYGG
jgi:hypothetical protein